MKSYLLKFVRWLALACLLIGTGCRTSSGPSALASGAPSAEAPQAVVIYADGRIEVEPLPSSGQPSRSKYRYDDPKKVAPATLRNYDQALVNSIEKKWYELSKPTAQAQTAEVVIDFRLHADG